MKVKIGSSNSHSHTLYMRVCPVCGKHFMRFHKATKWCSTRCRDIECHERYFDKEYRGRALKIRRQNERREKMAKELPKLKQVMSGGDECLLQYLLDTFSLLPLNKRNPKKGLRK